MTDKTFIVRYRNNTNGGHPLVDVFEDRNGALNQFHNLMMLGDHAFIICYTVRGSDGRFIFEREFKARI